MNFSVETAVTDFTPQALRKLSRQSTLPEYLLASSTFCLYLFHFASSLSQSDFPIPMVPRILYVPSSLSSVTIISTGNTECFNDQSAGKNCDTPLPLPADPEISSPRVRLPPSLLSISSGSVTVTSQVTDTPSALPVMVAVPGDTPVKFVTPIAFHTSTLTLPMVYFTGCVVVKYPTLPISTTDGSLDVHWISPVNFFKSSEESSKTLELNTPVSPTSTAAELLHCRSLMDRENSAEIVTFAAGIVNVYVSSS